MRNPIRPKNLSRRFAPWYAAGLLLVWISHPSVASVSAGLLPVALGLSIRTWGAGHLVKNERFTVTGPYAYLRHPLYLGTILIAVGFGSMLGGWPALAALSVALAWFFLDYFPRKEKVEGERLQSRYGDVYARYRGAVPALWPRLRRWRPAPADAEKLDIRHHWSVACYDRNNELGTLLAVTLAGLGLVLWAVFQ
jgi:protein-S-isoprenylcysteine O-methyltransferase Ste14